MPSSHPIVQGANPGNNSLAPAIGERLPHRLQWVLGPAFLEGYDHWRRTRVGERFFLTAHPDLDVNQLSNGKHSLTLLGQALDPFDPPASNRDVLAGLLRALIGGTDALAQVGSWGGRWVLIVDDGRAVKLCHDAMGLRQVFYTDAPDTRDMWCTSQPAIVAKMLNLGMKPEVLDLVRLGRWWHAEYWLPAELSPYDGLKRLLPNHWLDLRSGKSHRYWPARGLARLDLEDCVEKSAPILRGLMEAASRRFSLAISLTAGSDSRLVLAASRGIGNDASYVTVRKPGQPESDVEVPSRLLPRLGLTHEIVPWPGSINEEFVTMFRQNVPLPHDVWIPEAQACLFYSGLSKVAVTGSGGSASKRTFGPREKDSRSLTPESLASIFGMERSRFAVESFQAWLAGMPDIRAPDALDLVYWEQRCSSWLAMCQQEFDVAWRDIFTPYNCRLLLEQMLSVEMKHRIRPRHALHRALMSNLWPEVLMEPFPKKDRRSESVLGSIKRLLTRPARSEA